MDKLQKFLSKLPKKDYQTFSLLVKQIIIDYTKVPGLKKISGSKNLYQARFGRYRIIFSVKQKKFHQLVRVSKRDDQTYKDL